MTSTQPEVAALAAQAWAMMTRAEDTCPAGIAFDWLRTQADTDDVKALKLALYGVAADGLGDAPSNDWVNTHPHFCSMWREGYFDLLKVLIEIFRGKTHNAERKGWLPWCDRAEAALALCREIEGMPE